MLAEGIGPRVEQDVMGLLTTCIGAWPKPPDLPLRDWFQIERGLTVASGEVTRRAGAMFGSERHESAFRNATRQAVLDQLACGVDIPTDGEQRRENYIHYHCRHLSGFDFDNLTRRVVRDGAYTADLPSIRGPVRPREGHFLVRDFLDAQRHSDRPVKITVPGPITIVDTCADLHYGDARSLAFDLADALNYEIRALGDAGCRYIQVDEPLFARQIDCALDYGVECLERCFEGVGDGVTRAMHMCCGYPDHLDDEDYHKADHSCYFQLARAVDRSSMRQVSIEDAHRRNDLALLEEFESATVVLGSVAVARSRIETVEEIAERLQRALEHIDRDRLMAAPDCGLAMLGRERAMAKLSAMCEAARGI